MRERDRLTYTLVWVVVTVVLTAVLLVVGSWLSALAFVAVSGAGLVAFLRVTHPRGTEKPHLGIFFDDPIDEELADAPAPPAARRDEPEVVGHGLPLAAAPPAPPTVAPPPARPVAAPRPAPAAPAPAGADVIDLRQPARREAGASLDDAVAASNEAAKSVSSAAQPSVEVTEELAEHHLRLLRRVQVKLQDYE